MTAGIGVIAEDLLEAIYRKFNHIFKEEDVPWMTDRTVCMKKYIRITDINQTSHLSGALQNHQDTIVPF